MLLGVRQPPTSLWSMRHYRAVESTHYCGIGTGQHTTLTHVNGKSSLTSPINRLRRPDWAVQHNCGRPVSSCRDVEQRERRRDFTGFVFVKVDMSAGTIPVPLS